MKIVIKQIKNQVADFDSIFRMLEQTYSESQDHHLYLFPELFLTGYPLQDICLQNSFIKAYKIFIEKINLWSSRLEAKKTCFLLGGLEYHFANQETQSVPQKIENVIFKLEPGKKLEKIYTKMLLPNYDIFDEKKYFTKGESAQILNWNDKKIGLLICEDMWHSNVHNIDPVASLKALGEQVDLVVNLSASPYNLYKTDKRFQRAQDISNILEAPFIYVNQVSGEDEILFDGESFIANGDKIMHKLARFAEDTYTLELPEYLSPKTKLDPKQNNTWEDLFSPDIDFTKKPLPKLKELSDDHCQEILDALCFGLQEYAKKNGFSKFTIALSGGIDSALVLAITKISLLENQTLEAIYMPSEFSREISLKASKKMCEDARIPFKVLPIQKSHQNLRDLFKTEMGDELQGLADENIQSRLRGLLLYARSNQTNSMVINTSNKSELAVGYSTLYGDSVGAISLLGDIYKSEVYHLSRYISKKYNSLIPEDIITRPPSAELREDQVDTDSLPAYDILDTILEGILSYRMTRSEFIELGFSKEDIDKTLNLYRKSEFKRTQFCPIIKIKSKSFGFGYRVPISKKSDYYFS